MTVDGVRVITALEFRNHRFGGEVLISNVTGSWQHDLILQMERRAPQEFNGAQLKIPGIVRSVHPTMGMGIEFVGVTSEIMQALEGIVKSQAAEASANPD